MTCEQLVKQDVFSAVLEVCILTYLQLCECKFVIIFLFCDFFHFLLAVNMSLSDADTKIFALHRGRNGKGAHFIHPTRLAYPSRP